MNLVGKVDGVTYMLPFYNYAMGLTYRKDLLDDSEEQAAFKEKYGIDLRVPETWDEYMKQVEFFTRDTDGNGQVDFYGVVNQGLRPDPIAMEWSNYLYANGGQYYEEGTWQPTLDSPEAVAALEAYKTNLSEYGPPGAASFGFDEAFNVAAQGKAFSYITYNMFRTAYDDPEQSAVVGQVEIAPVPNGGLNGAWGWAIPNSSPNPEAAWTFLKWIESPEIAKERALLGGSPTRSRRVRRSGARREVPVLSGAAQPARHGAQLSGVHLHAAVRRGARARALARGDGREEQRGSARRPPTRSSRSCSRGTASSEPAQGIGNGMSAALASAAIERGDRRFGWLMAAPSLLALFLVILFPILFTLYTSAFDYTLIQPTHDVFVGLDHYAARSAMPSSARRSGSRCGSSPRW